MDDKSEFHQLPQQLSDEYEDQSGASFANCSPDDDESQIGFDRPTKIVFDRLIPK